MIASNQVQERLSRTLMDIMSIMGLLLSKGVNLYSVKDGYSFDNSINSKVLIFAFGLVAEIERNLISLRTKEALELRKLQGVKLGRPSMLTCISRCIRLVCLSASATMAHLVKKRYSVTLV